MSILVMNKRNMIIGLLIIAVALGAYYVYSARSFDAQDPLARYREAMRADSYGGKTPEETLRLFVAALRAGNVELASKYFLLDDNLSREKSLQRLTDIKKKGSLERMADDIERDAKPVVSADGNYIRYELLNNDGTLNAQIGIRLNKFSGVWKLQSF